MSKGPRLASLTFAAMLVAVAFLPIIARAEVDTTPPEVYIDLDFRRDGRCYFDIDADLTMPGSAVGALSSGSNSPTVPLSEGRNVITVYGEDTAGNIGSATSMVERMVGQAIGQLVSIEGDVSLEIASPESGKFKLTASGWVTIPPEEKPQVEFFVAGYKAAPEATNARLLELGRAQIDESREDLPAELADLQLEELRITSLDLRDSRLSFGVTATVSSQGFTKTKLLEKIDELGLGAEATQQMKKLVEEFFGSLPLGTELAFKVSATDEEFSLELDAQGLKKGEKVGTLSIALEISGARKYATFELLGKRFEEGEVTGQVSVSFEASKAQGVFSSKFNAEVLTKKEVLGRIGATLEVSEAEEKGDFYLNLYSPKASLTSEVHIDGQDLKIDGNGWIELPRVGENVRGKFPIEELLWMSAPSWVVTRPTAPAYLGGYPEQPQLPEIEEILEELEARLHVLLEEIDVELIIKVPSDAELVGLPPEYQIVDSAYKWIGSAADEALVRLLMGSCEVAYKSGVALHRSDLPPDEPEVIDIPENLVVRKIAMTPKVTVTTNVMVVHVDKPPECPEPEATVYKYLKVETDKSEDVENCEIEFKVEISWIENNNIDRETVKLLRYQEGRWNPLSTRKVDEDDVYLYFSAETTGFSYFAIAGELAAPLIPPEEIPPKPFPWHFVAIGMVIALALVGVALYTKRKSS